TDYERGYVIGQRSVGTCFTEIAHNLGRCVRATRRVWHDWMVDGRRINRLKSGRARLSTPQEDRELINVKMKHRKLSSRKLAEKWMPGKEGRVSQRTVRRRLNEKRMLIRNRTVQRIPLTTLQRHLRHDWCMESSDWKDEWKNIVFSNVANFTLFNSDARVLVRRRCNERLQETYIEPNRQKQKMILVWGAISYNARTPLIRIEKTLSGRCYIDSILRPIVVPFLSRMNNPLFQQDNSRSHVAEEVREFMRNQGIRTLSWPTRSSDLNPMGRIWDMIGLQIQQHSQPTDSFEDLWYRVERAWMEIPQSTIQRLFNSMPRRIAAVIAANGDYTRCARSIKKKGQQSTSAEA
ncbi:hypothetical protein AMK59_2720, partial [Oryctes borbonicus]